ncbi:MAG: hypothetical protein JJ896_06110 [Rhodothermales bacterium]|nr:hypothetical protein [Rhodothermales bacterium]MBO6779207.1 hypothetical protein [Rhodothermales bacterium]
MIDALGLVGVALILGSYVLLQTDRWSAREARYSAANAVGAALILVTLYFDFNLSAAVIEGFWLLVSLYGLLKARHPQPATPENGPQVG